MIVGTSKPPLRKAKPTQHALPAAPVDIAEEEKPQVEDPKTEAPEKPKRPKPLNYDERQKLRREQAKII